MPTHTFISKWFSDGGASTKLSEYSAQTTKPKMVDVLEEEEKWNKLKKSEKKMMRKICKIFKIRMATNSW